MASIEGDLPKITIIRHQGAEPDLRVRYDGSGVEHWLNMEQWPPQPFYKKWVLSMVRSPMVAKEQGEALQATRLGQSSVTLFNNKELS
jgi:hypothetical protein